MWDSFFPWVDVTVGGSIALITLGIAIAAIEKKPIPFKKINELHHLLPYAFITFIVLSVGTGEALHLTSQKLFSIVDKEQSNDNRDFGDTLHQKGKDRQESVFNSYRILVFLRFLFLGTLAFTASLLFYLNRFDYSMRAKMYVLLIGIAFFTIFICGYCQQRSIHTTLITS